MYIPPAFAEDRPDELLDIIRAASLPVLISQARGKLIATHLPLTMDGERLIGHFARANEHWKLFDATLESIAIFTAVDGYISPSWYPTKAETGRVVPTWNYEAVHAYGRLEIIEDPIELLQIVTKLTDRYEALRDKPWHVSDAPNDYITSQLHGIVGATLHVDRLEGKRKLSQNKSTPDRQGVIAGLKRENPALSAAMDKVSNG
jgi:transcriptional regulator